jgi:hypothetical protein
MTNKSKIALIAAVVAFGFASLALAGAIPGYGSDGSVAALGHKSNGHEQSNTSAAGRRGLYDSFVAPDSSSTDPRRNSTTTAWETSVTEAGRCYEPAAPGCDPAIRVHLLEDQLQNRPETGRFFVCPIVLDSRIMHFNLMR